MKIMEKPKRFLRDLFKTDKEDDGKVEIMSSMTQYWIIGAVMLVLVATLFIWNLK